jgi:hypothetical protein
MSEFNPFSAAEEAPEHTEVAEESGEGRKKVVLLGALAAVVLGAGAFLLLGGGGEDELEEFTPAARAPRAAAPAVTPAPALKKLPVTSKVTLGRNPFRALYVAPAAGGSTGTTTTPVSTGGGTTSTPVTVGSGSGSTPVAPVRGGTTYTPPADQPAPAPAPPAAQSTVSLKGVTAGKSGANPTGTFVYDGQQVTGAAGDVMAKKLLVISVQQDATGGWFANLQLGDGSPFEVHERQTVVVQ